MYNLWKMICIHESKCHFIFNHLVLMYRKSAVPRQPISNFKLFSNAAFLQKVPTGSTAFSKALETDTKVHYFLTNQYHTSYVMRTLWQSDPKDGYGKSQEKLSKMSRTEILRMGLKELKKEIHKWKEEIKDKLESDPILLFREGEIDIVFKFDTAEKLDRWITTSDSDHSQGMSKCSLITTNLGTGLFSGEINTRPPGDGRIKIAGYCNITSRKVMRSFKRESAFDWTQYTHLVLKVRGDGRSYMINLICSGSYDITWNDTYHFVLYTRGGPYWQVTKIPFSKFLFGTKGRVQDVQTPIPLFRVRRVGITAADNINGPFSLEIDYIGVEVDSDHTEDFAYEMYDVGKYIVNT